jgi:dihydroxyacetone kinase-like protein
MTDLTAAAATAMVHATSLRVAAAAAELSRLDAVAGDGDHGVNMAAAFAAADTLIAAKPPSDAAHVFLLVGRAFEDSGSGSAGALFSAFFGALGQDLIGASPARTIDVVDALYGATDRVASLGRAAAGDKTMLDALRPAVEAARAAAETGAPLESILTAAGAAAAAGAEATAGMPARAGRARYAPDGALATRDPGAVTIALMFEAWAHALLADRTPAMKASS